MTLKKRLYIHYSGLLGNRAFPVRGVLLRRWSWNGHSFVTLRKRLHIHCLGLSRHWALWGNTGLLGRLSWYDHSSVTLEKTTHSLLRSGDWAFHVCRVLLRKWSWNGHLLVTLEKTLHIHCLGLPGDRSLLISRVLLWKMILEVAIYWLHWGRHPAHSLFKSPWTQISLSQSGSTVKTVLKWLIICCWHLVRNLLFRSPGTEVFESLELYLEETYTLFRSPGRQSFLNW